LPQPPFKPYPHPSCQAALQHLRPLHYDFLVPSLSTNFATIMA
jgi:hypothetical protein